MHRTRGLFLLRYLRTMFHRFDTAAISPTPWKNGGGTTLELHCSPPGATLADFDWRVSIATVASSGPFSRFPGIDRTIVLLSGEGMRLRAADGSIDHPLTEPGIPFSFPGEACVEAILAGGVSSDFNLMTRRPRRGEVGILREAASLTLGMQGLIYASAGRWLVGALTLEGGQGLHWSHAEPAQAADARPLSPDAMLIVVRML
jgi:environmental stress-induced protein Ves